MADKNTATAKAPEQSVTDTPTVESILKAAEKKSTPWVPLQIKAVDGGYELFIPSKITYKNLKPSSTGKSVISTFRLNAGGERYPLVIERENAEPLVLEFGSLNIPMTLFRPRS